MKLTCRAFTTSTLATIANLAYTQNASWMALVLKLPGRLFTAASQPERAWRVDSMMASRSGPYLMLTGDGGDPARLANEEFA
jgi:hypothetical protein